MAPVLQALVAITVCVLLGLLFLRQMAFIVRSYLAHMCQVVLVVLRGVLLGILFQDLDNLAPTRDISNANSAAIYRHTSHDRRFRQSACRDSSQILWKRRL